MSRREAIRQMEAEAEAQIEDYTKVLQEDETKEVYEFMVRVCPCRCGHRTTMRLLYCYSLLGKLEAPPRTDPISRLVDSQLFSFATAMLMLANCWFMARVADDDMEAYSSGSEPSGEFQRIGEQIFLGLYSVEFLFKFWRQRSYFWVDSNWKYNWLDVGLISISLYFMVLSDVLAGVSWLRILRVCKLAKLLRVVKLASTFKVLRNMLTSLINSVGTLAWSLVLLLMILFLFALTFVQRTAAFLSTEAATLDEAELTALVESFGGVGVTMRNLYMCMTGGNDWSVYYEPLAPTGVLNQLIFLLFVAFTQIALLNIILGVFVDKAMKNMSVGPQELALEHLEMEREQEQNLYDLCNHADQNGDGIITLQEWRRALNRGDLTGYLQMIGIRPENMIELFKVLQNDSGEVNVHRFVRGCICMKGNASSFDVHLVLQDIKDLSRLSDERHEELQQALAKLGAF
jgi:hypothetical protein